MLKLNRKREKETQKELTMTTDKSPKKKHTYVSVARFLTNGKMSHDKAVAILSKLEPAHMVGGEDGYSDYYIEGPEENILSAVRAFFLSEGYGLNSTEYNAFLAALAEAKGK